MKAITQSILRSPSLSTLPVRIEEGILPALVTGTYPLSRAMLASSLHLETGRPMLVICPDEAAANRMADDIRALTGEEVRCFFGRDLLLREADSISRQSEQSRLQTLDALLQNRSPITVCSADGLVLFTVSPEKLQDNSITVTMDGPGPEELEQFLIGAGYSRCEMVEGFGQYSRRGSIIDIFSPGSEQPLRIDFWGDDVDSMGYFDIESQRREQPADSVRILPAAEVLPSLSTRSMETLFQGFKSTAQHIRRSQENASRCLFADADALETGRILPWFDRYLPVFYPEKNTLLDYIARDSLIIFDSPGHCADRVQDMVSRLEEQCTSLKNAGLPVSRFSEYTVPWEKICAQLGDFALIMTDAFTAGKYPLNPRSLLSYPARHMPSYGGSLETAVEDIRHFLNIQYKVVVLASDERRAKILASALERSDVSPLQGFPNGELPPAGRCCVAVGALSSGFDDPEGMLAILTDAQIIAGGLRTRKKKKALANREKLQNCSDLSVGDLVVHDVHGIGRFAGIFKIASDGVMKDYIKINYAGTDSLYVPATQLDMVSKYIGAGEDSPVKLSKLGGTDWYKTKVRTKAAVRKMAAELLKLYAQRRATPGFAFEPDTPWQTEFEESFGYAETEDQLRCIKEIKTDMQSSTPMDRLLCGDVGYGKTEVALRAVMKCILSNKQAALLCPTTVLARQHYQTACQRFFGFPVTIEVISRMRSSAEVKRILTDVKSGKVDLLIGTHRLLQSDVEFKDLGLFVVDEEQRFGVTHKEKLKQMSKGVDVLTLSATPIPRTLNMALSGIRSLSTIEEPPRERQPVVTYVVEHSWETVCDAIRKELLRGGQVYYLHNRTETIEKTALKIKNMIGNVNVGVVHGKLDEQQISAVMDDMMEGRIQILVCTTIIETGIDIPNVNTLIIEDADKLGLAQLHQIRGRVGRSSRRASAYLTYRRDKSLTEIAEKRLAAIRDFAEFNAGFQIAMRDLEIRGAGNLLGAEQSGHMIDVGYDMYLKLLNEAVLEEKGEKAPVRTECSADLSLAANIPERYIRSSEQRMDIYRRIALIRTEEDADDLTDELIDRFGDPPSSVNALIHIALLRSEAANAGITDISQKNGFLFFTLQDFDISRLSALCAVDEFKGRVKLDASKNTPRISLKLRSTKNILAEARSLIKAWHTTEPKKEGQS